jgi:hypothetical protein
MIDQPDLGNAAPDDGGMPAGYSGGPRRVVSRPVITVTARQRLVAIVTALII